MSNTSKLFEQVFLRYTCIVLKGLTTAYFGYFVLIGVYIPRRALTVMKYKAPPPSSKLAQSGEGKQKTKGTYNKHLSEVPKYKLVNPSILSDRLRISGSLARRAIKDLTARGSIRMISAHASQQIYTRAINT
ncbi:hypothetical protein WN944_018821 [Citrus x changshan-huyou]|uniref:40S ribosomal protein S25 n=1 Tax=Citrus x changshan-huyou TaxID=2935761 RepID=A0AAP0LV40_9ROSI